MSIPTKPTIVIVQDSFQTPLFYGALLTGLLDAGYPVIHARLPSCTNVDDADFPTCTLTDDSLAVTVAIQRLVEAEGKTVVVAMHSYGGLVGSNAIPEELSYAHRQARRLAGGVIHLFYFCAFILGKGQSVLGAFGESPNNDVRVCMHILHISITILSVIRFAHLFTARWTPLHPQRSQDPLQ